MDESILEFKKNPEKALNKISENGLPLFLTESGKSKYVLTAIEDFQRYVDAMDFVDSVNAIKESIEQMKRGEGIDAVDFLHQKIKEHQSRI